MKRLKVGDKAPQFVAKDANGDLFYSSQWIEKKAFILFFYPKDDTLICTKQVCGFRDNYTFFKDNNVEVIGISKDNASSHQDFKLKYSLPFLLLSDENKEIQNLYGVSSALFGLLSGRVSFLIDTNGFVSLVFSSIFASGHITKFVEKIKKQQV